MEEFRYRPIGVIRSEHKGKADIPIQSAFGKDSKGRVEVSPEFAAGLRDIEGFSHVILIYHFHLSNGYELSVKPFLDDEEHGLFTTRSPKRPNPIGFSVVKVEKVEGNVLHVSEVDIIDGTPLLDIKPYVAEFDSRNTEKQGWLEGKIEEGKTYLSDRRFG